MRTESDGIAAQLRGFRFDPSHPGGALGTVQGLRAMASKRWRLVARADYLDALAKGSTGPYVAPADQADKIGADVIRSLVEGMGWPGSATTFPGRLDEALDRMIARADTLASHFADDAEVNQRRLPIHDYVDRTAGKIRRHAEVRPTVDAARAARAALPGAFASALGAAIDAAGPDALVTSLREAQILGDSPPFPPDPSAGSLATDRTRLAVLDEALGKLGVTDPGAKTPPKNLGLTGAKLWEERASLAKGIRDAVDQAEARLLALCNGLLSTAKAGDLSSWLTVYRAAADSPGAFPDGFKAAWTDAYFAAYSLAGAGALSAVLDEG